ncbi:hypothetical protein AE937_01280 [Bacteroides fragilis]|uniref:Uncharacterized protein n=1 Tax=Bacteroides fragilis TaxID=817 RepID=A0A413JTQ1_BACFG|nr:hypothetical protein [Bacteroides fragilis]RGY65228.1 hypothetical protein DXA27_20530 [Bacteroides fragilis]
MKLEMATLDQKIQLTFAPPQQTIQKETKEKWQNTVICKSSINFQIKKIFPVFNNNGCILTLTQPLYICMKVLFFQISPYFLPIS